VIDVIRPSLALSNDHFAVRLAHDNRRLKPTETQESAVWKSLAVRLQAWLDTETMESLSRAISFVQVAHNGQTRPDGRPFSAHISDVLTSLIVGFSESTLTVLTAAVLHDTVEDANVTVDKIRQNFGASVAKMVDQLTQDESREIYLQRFHSGTSVDILRIKLADRLSNIQGDHKHFNPQCRYLQETADNFLILATGDTYFGPLFLYWLRRAGCVSLGRPVQRDASF
jgi:guanosine-3',5'-bis(diphosphate) 3'-pyrophosphohydrolase